MKQRSERTQVVLSFLVALNVNYREKSKQRKLWQYENPMTFMRYRCVAHAQSSFASYMCNSWSNARLILWNCKNLAENSLPNTQKMAHSKRESICNRMRDTITCRSGAYTNNKLLHASHIACEYWMQTMPSFKFILWTQNHSAVNHLRTYFYMRNETTENEKKQFFFNWINTTKMIIIIDVANSGEERVQVNEREREIDGKRRDGNFLWVN